MIAFLLFLACVVVFYYFKNKNAFLALSPFIVVIDSFSYSIAATLNFYKIMPWIYFKEVIFEKGVIRKLIYLLVFSFLAGLVFIYINSNLTNPLGENFFRTPIVKLLRNQFTLWSYVLSSYWLLKTFQVKGAKYFLKTLIYLNIVIAIGVIISGFIEYDFYHFFSGVVPNIQNHGYFRSKGFMFEPRGAALALAILLPYIALVRSNKVFLLITPVVAYSLLRTLSVSGIFVAFTLMISSILIALFLFKERVFFVKRFAVMLSIVAVMFAVFYYSPTTLGEYFRGNMRERSFIVEGTKISQRSLIKFVSHFECFDAAYLNFIFQNPAYAVFGVGSGMGGIASQKYFLRKDYYLFPNGSDSLPLVGAVFALAQFGLFGICFIFYLIYSNFKGSHPLIKFIMLISLLSFLLQYLYTIFFLLFSILLAEYVNKSKNRADIESQLDDILSNRFDISL